MTPLAAFEEIIDASEAAPRIEAMLPTGVRAGQMSVRPCWPGYAWPPLITARRT
jgi:hypothetical protein